MYETTFHRSYPNESENYEGSDEAYSANNTSDSTSSYQEEDYVNSDEEENNTDLAEEENYVDSTEEKNITDSAEKGQKMQDQDAETDNESDREEDDEDECDVISAIIQGMKYSSIGNFSMRNKHFNDHVIKRMREIRDLLREDQFVQIQEEMKDMVYDDKLLAVHRNIRNIYEFVMYMFVLYDVPIDDLVPENDDKKLRTTMSNAIRK